ncbi:alpha/beta hydrolase [Longispora sp. NPDC051575]|uniref:alpha/beta hydrolase family protein n=1 Tax=Longispora sp. NPDC051575 TaxID=3154943 RepID=UPI00341D8BBF
MWKRIVLGAVVLAVLVAGAVVYRNTYDLREEKVTIGTLDAVLALPTSIDRPVGLVVFVHGDGPVDATHDGFYRPLWEAFARAGYASLSWNKPGVAGSAGDWLGQTMEDRAAEVAGAIAWARARPDIDAHRIGLWGASQAGWVMPKVAARTPGLAFVIAVAPAVNWLQQGRFNLLAELRARGASPAEVTAAVARSDRERALLDAGASYADYRREPDADPDLTAGRWTFITRNHRSDATADLTAAATVPTLLLLGGHDINVDVADTEAGYRRTLKNLQVRHYPDATHGLVPKALEDSPVRLVLTGLFAPRSVFATGVLTDQTRYLTTVTGTG